MEIWKPIKNWESLYEISDHGNVRSLRNKKNLKSSSINNYRQVSFSLNSKMKTFRIHRLVAIAFIPNPKNKSEVNHIDGNKSNNHISNLEWVTPHENVKHSYNKLGRIPIHGETHNKAKLSNKDVLEIRKKYIPYKYSYAKLGNEYGVDQSTIHLLIKCKNWKYL